MNELIEKILEYVEPDDEITASSHLRKDCGLTSFDLTSMVSDICTERGIDYKSLNLRNIESVGELAEAIGMGD